MSLFEQVTKMPMDALRRDHDALTWELVGATPSFAMLQDLRRYVALTSELLRRLAERGGSDAEGA